jgi:REP element-mobilizing transposase RayT
LCDDDGPRASRPHKGWHERGYLPHFDAGAVVQTITFRVADSLPRALYAQMVADIAESAELRPTLDRLIDEGRGGCLLRDAGNAEIVRSALEHFDGERYRLVAWAIMPNHVHAMVEQMGGHALGDIVHAWKSYTAKAINKRRRSQGTVWAADYFDRYIRDAEHYEAAVYYIENNPVNAGLVGRAEDWRFSSARQRNATI